MRQSECLVAASDRQASREYGAGADATSSDDDRDDCHAYEYRLVASDGGPASAQQLLLEVCNDGYGAAGVGEDAVSVDPRARTFTHEQVGGSAWRWNTTTVLGLDPLRVISRGESTFWTLDVEGTEASSAWNFDTFVGTSTWSAPDCVARRKQAAQNAEVIAAKSAEALVIPRVQLPPAFVGDGWRTTALGACAAYVDGDQHGFAIHGGPGGATDASLRVVISGDGVLFAEVSDDRWSGAGASWVREDHLELWLAASSQVASQRCDEAEAEPALAPAPARQWGVRIADGKVFPAFGSPAPLANVEVARAGPIARLKIPLAPLPPEEWQAITVVYSDSDDGIHQERLIATSRIARGDASTLGSVHGVDPLQATCDIAANENALRIVRPPLNVHPEQAIIE